VLIVLKTGSLKLLETSGLVQACNGIALPLPFTLLKVGWDRSVGIAGRSGDRIPVRAKFSAPVQTGPGAHRTSLQWVPGLFRGREVKRPGCGFDHPPTTSAEIKERVEL
jgi:hypothetical protein